MGFTTKTQGLQSVRRWRVWPWAHYNTAGRGEQKGARPHGDTHFAALRGASQSRRAQEQRPM